MGLISLIANVASTVGGSISSEFKDQYTEFFTCDSLGQNVLVKKGATKIKNGNNKGNEDVITNGSKIAVPEGTALLLVDAGKVVDFTTEAGMYTWDSSTSPSVLCGSGTFLENAKAAVKDSWERMKMGGEIAKQQRVYFVNLLEIRDNKYGTPSALPYPDPEYRNIYIRLNGFFSFKIADPVTFFKNVAANVADEFTVEDLMGKPADPKLPRSEFIDNIGEVLNKCGSVDKIMFATLPSEQGRLRRYMQDALDQDWLQNRGMLIEAVAIISITPDDKSRARIEQVDDAKMFGSDPNALAAQAILGQTEAMKLAGGNSAGAATGLMGLGMMGAMGGGNSANAAFGFMGQQQQMQQQQMQQQQMQQQPAQAPAAQAAGWTCACGQAGNSGKFCSNCGQPQAVPSSNGWTCSCGMTGNTGKFCSECGKPQQVAGCSKCGWKPNPGESTPKFCPECGNKL